MYSASYTYSVYTCVDESHTCSPCGKTCSEPDGSCTSVICTSLLVHKSTHGQLSLEAFVQVTDDPWHPLLNRVASNPLHTYQLPTWLAMNLEHDAVADWADVAVHVHPCSVVVVPQLQLWPAVRGHEHNTSDQPPAARPLHLVTEQLRNTALAKTTPAHSRAPAPGKRSGA